MLISLHPGTSLMVHLTFQLQPILSPTNSPLFYATRSSLGGEFYHIIGSVLAFVLLRGHGLSITCSLLA